MEWISPCRCSGSTKWVHHSCLLRWINESRGVDVTVCPQCKTPYQVAEPENPLVVRLGSIVDHAVNILSPVGFGLLATASLWAGLSAYGAVTFAHVCGRDGRAILRNADPVRLFMVMPAIPLILILVRVRIAVNLRIARTRATAAPAPAPAPRVPLDGSGSDTDTDTDGDAEIDAVVNAAAPAAGNDELELQLPDIQDHSSVSRLVAGGLVLPYVSSAIGRVLFRTVTLHPLDRTLLGGVVFLVIKGVAKHWYRISRRRTQAHRRIASYDPPA